MTGTPEPSGAALAKPEPRECVLCGRETTDWTVSVGVDDDGRQTRMLWCRDAEECLRAHEVAESAALGRA